MNAAGSIRVCAGQPAEDELRDGFVERHPRGSFFHLAGWRRVVRCVFGHAERDLLAWRGDELAGVLPLMACRSGFGRTNLISVPYAVYGGALGADAEVERALHRAAVSAAEAEGCGRLELRCREDPGLDLPTSELYATFVRELPGRPEQVLAGMPKKARAEARKARERHALVLLEEPHSLELFVRLFQENKRRLGTPALPARMFRALAAEFGERVVVHVVRRRGEPLAAVMSFVHGGDLYAYYSGSAAHADRECSASNFMYMALQEWCVARELRRFDFGRSRRDAGAFAFKLHQGFEPTALHYRYHLVRDRALPALHPSNPRTRWLRQTWTHVPRWLARRLALPLSRRLP